MLEGKENNGMFTPTFPIVICLFLIKEDSGIVIDGWEGWRSLFITTELGVKSSSLKVLKLEMSSAEIFECFGHAVRKGENPSTWTIIWWFRS